MMKIKRIIKSEIIVITRENLEQLIIVFAIEDTKHKKKFQQYFTIVLHMIVIFLIKQLAKEFDSQFECLGENTEKYIIFSVPIRKELDNS